MTEIIFSHHIIPCCYSLRMMQVGKTIYLNDFDDIMKNVSKDEEKFLLSFYPLTYLTRKLMKK